MHDSLLTVQQDFTSVVKYIVLQLSDGNELKEIKAHVRLNNTQ